MDFLDNLHLVRLLVFVELQLFGAELFILALDLFIGVENVGLIFRNLRIELLLFLVEDSGIFFALLPNQEPRSKNVRNLLFD